MTEKNTDTIDINRIMEMIPHRYPLLLVDRILEINNDRNIIGLKNVSINEPHFTGHFPGHPVMPGVLIIEAMAQTSAVLVISTLGSDTEGKLVYFMSVESAKFRKPVVPGDAIELHIEKVQSRGTVWKFKGEAFVDGKLCAEAKFSAMIVDS